MQHNGTELEAMTYNGQEVDIWIHNGVEVFRNLVEYIYRTGSWLVPYSIGEWTEQEGNLYNWDSYKGKGSKTAATLSFTLDVTNAETISVTYTMVLGGTTNANPWGRLNLYSETDSDISVSASSSSMSDYSEHTITLDVSSLKGEQTFKIQHIVGQNYEQSPYIYEGHSTLKIFNIDVSK